MKLKIVMSGNPRKLHPLGWSCSPIIQSTSALCQTTAFKPWWRIVLLIPLTVILLMIVLVSAAQQDVFVLTLEYKEKNVAVQNLLITKGYFTAPVNQPADGYILKLISSKNKVLYEQTFDFSLEVHFSPPLDEWFDEKGNQIYIPNESETRTVLDTATVELLFPYYNDATRIDIYYTNKTRALSIPVNTESEVAIENVRLDTSTELPQASAGQESTAYSLTSKPILIVIIVVFVFIIFAVLLVLFILARKKQPEEAHTY